MSVKTELLKILESHRDEALSGQEMADLLGVSRTAIWKAVKLLKEEGYQIEAANKKGYRLRGDSDLLSAEGILLNLDPKYQNREVVVFKCLDSTNQEVKRRALEGAGEGLVVLSEEQTKGKGRQGRSFVSPPGTGIYMSILFRPTEKNSKDVILVTTAASVAICRAIRKVVREEPQIKWVNDVYLRGKKICGILTEAVSDFESGKIQTVVVGIGINYREPDGGFPEELRGIAGAIVEDDRAKTTPVTRNVLVAAILDELYALYEGLAERSYMDDYKKWSNVLGKEVRFLDGGAQGNLEVWEYGTAIDLDRDGGLIVRLKDGRTRTLKTGEITLRVEKDGSERGVYGRDV